MLVEALLRGVHAPGVLEVVASALGIEKSLGLFGREVVGEHFDSSRFLLINAGNFLINVLELVHIIYRGLFLRRLLIFGFTSRFDGGHIFRHLYSNKF